MNHRVLLKIKKTLSTYLDISSINIFKVFTFFHFLQPNLTWRETNKNRASLNLLENVIFIRWTFIMRKILKQTLNITKNKQKTAYFNKWPPGLRLSPLAPLPAVHLRMTLENNHVWPDFSHIWQWQVVLRQDLTVKPLRLLI